MSTWIKSTSSNRVAVISQAGVSYFSIELNGDGSSTLPGRVSFVMDDGSGPKAAVSFMSDLNDGEWHHVTGVRANNLIYIYVDGALAGEGSLGGGFAGITTTAPDLGRKGAGNYYNGLIDEVIIWGRALTEAEIGQVFAGAYRTKGTGLYISQMADAGDPAIWTTLSWVTDGPYGKPLAAGDPTLEAVWHMEEPSGVISNAIAANDGTVNGATYGVAGRFDKCLDFNGAASFVSVLDNVVLEMPDLTIEAWINADDVVSRPIVDKSSGGANGYAIGLDAAGLPYFRVGATTCTGYVPVRVGKWTHIAGCYDTVSSRLRLYVDGILTGITAPVAVSTASGQPLIIGRNAAGGVFFDGRIDEVAVHSRALKQGEIEDHYRAGAVTLKIQGRSSNDPLFGGVNFVGPDKTINTYFTQSSGCSLTNSMDLGRYFQYKAYFATEDARYSPRLSGVRVYVANYPTGNPTVEPDSLRAIYFPGRLRSFSDITIPGGAGANVRYQISGDSGATPSWYWWNGAGQWTNDAPADYNFANPVGVINANITNFFQSFYSTAGGTLRFRAFLHSAGDYQIKLDKVDFVASAGRIVVTVPNGDEIGSKAWVVGTPQTIR
ncbi:MAG: LamG domain-containing protein, partial [Methylobacter sp.]